MNKTVHEKSLKCSTIINAFHQGLSLTTKLPIIFFLGVVLELAPAAAAAERQFAEDQEIKVRRLALQAKYAELPEVKLNQDPKAVKFGIIDMRKSVFDIDGKKYCAFRFKTGGKVSQLTWCFRCPPGLIGWYIHREKGQMEGFYTFQKFMLYHDKQEWGSKGDSFAVQSLPSTSFEPNTGYIMWFQITEAADSAINLSLNMTDVADHAPFSAVFSEIKL